MAKKSRQRKPEIKRPPETPAGRKDCRSLPQLINPGGLPPCALVLAVVTAFLLPAVCAEQRIRLLRTTTTMWCRIANVQHGVEPRRASNGHLQPLLRPTGTRLHGSPTSWTGSLYGKHPAATILRMYACICANAILLLLLLIYMTGFIRPIRNGRIFIRAAPRAC